MALPFQPSPNEQKRLQALSGGPVAPPVETPTQKLGQASANLMWGGGVSGRNPMRTRQHLGGAHAEPGPPLLTRQIVEPPIKAPPSSVVPPPVPEASPPALPQIASPMKRMVEMSIDIGNRNGMFNPPAALPQYVTTPELMKNVGVASDPIVAMMMDRRAGGLANQINTNIGRSIDDQQKDREIGINQGNLDARNEELGLSRERLGLDTQKLGAEMDAQKSTAALQSAQALKLSKETDTMSSKEEAARQNMLGQLMKALATKSDRSEYEQGLLELLMEGQDPSTMEWEAPVTGQQAKGKWRNFVPFVDPSQEEIAPKAGRFVPALKNPPA